MSLPFHFSAALIVGFVGALLGCAMLALVLWQGPDRRGNQWMAFYFASIMLWGTAAFFLRVKGLVGGSTISYLKTIGGTAQLVSLSLFGLLCHHAGISKRLSARVLGILGLMLLGLNIYLYIGAQTIKYAYFTPQGVYNYAVYPAGNLTFGTVVLFACVNCSIALRYRDTLAHKLLPGTLCASLGTFITPIPALRSIPLPILFTSISAMLFARVVLDKNLFDPLNAAKRKAERASAAKTMFLARMGHELRTPLNAILGYCELASEEIEAGDIKSAEGDLGKVIGAGKHLLSLVEDVIDVAKIEEGMLRLAPEAIELHSLVKDLKELMGPLAAKNHNEFNVIQEDIDPSLSLYHDPTRLRQVLVNLLGNASKFTQQGRITLEIQINNPVIIFRVKDTGIGMSQEQQARVFEEFQQAHEHVEKQYGGTGLGLSISNRLSQLMGGSLKCTSELGQGSVFELRLPQRLDATP